MSYVGKKRMSNGNTEIKPERFKVFVRYMIQVAKEKRCVPYNELENIFGLNHIQVGYYAGKLGSYCFDREIPPLNGLIISSTDCVPSKGFDWYQEQYETSWGEIVSQCWQYFHITSSREKQVQNFSGRDRDVEDYLNCCEN